MPLAVYLHQLDPFALRLWGNVGIRWYGLSYVAGFIAAYLILYMLARRGRILLQPAAASDFIVAAALGTVVGGRVGYALFYDPALVIDFSGQFPFWGLLAMWKGGMASHGGIIGLVIACLRFARKHKLPTLHLFDLIALTGPVGIFFGRIANFINGELFGRECRPDLPWAVKFPQEMLDWKAPRLAELRAVLGPAQGQQDSSQQLVQQTLDMIQRGNRAVIEAVEPLLPPRHPSQIYEALLEGLFMFAAMWILWRKPRKPGIVAGAFLVIYPVVRFIGEQFRTPDAHIGFEALGLTRGQWLSILMLAIGIVCLAAWSRRPAEPIGGWSGPARRAPHEVRPQNAD
jgi:phosphatidylglycerol---prolipoprotein diacylglyceryl transferase